MSSKKHIIYTLLILLFSTKVSLASHIVGGEPELRHISGNEYRIGLVLYFDDINGERDALDLDFDVHIYSKSTNTKIKSLNIALKESSVIPFSQKACFIPSLRTRRLYYWTNHTLNPSEFTEEAGYYIVWERCCRNATIDNINEPNQIGQAFYMEFAALQDAQGRRFIDSTPSLFRAVSDYPCVGQAFRMDFGSDDPNGDSLAYRLVVPLKGFSRDDFGNRLPPPRPRPYPEVEFVSGIGINNMIPGKPPLRIDAKTGMLTVTPDKAGLFVFAVAVDAFRKGRKIGEVRREFQVLVRDCLPASPPVVRFKQDSKTTFYNEGDTIFFGLGEKPCGVLEITDKSGNSNIQAILTRTNFKNVGSVDVETRTGIIKSPNDVLKMDVCFPSCPVDEASESFILDVLVKDNTCSVPLIDTLKVVVGSFSQKSKIFFPNVFTPNGDAINDTFGVPDSIKKQEEKRCKSPLFSMQIFNRWGKKVFENTDITQDWRGKGFPSGTYFYLIRYNSQTFKGSVSLLRNK